VFDHCADNGCDPACGAGSICVRTQTLGGALIQPDDAGVCPSGTYLVPSGGTGPGFCEGNPSFACAPRPAACTGALSCDCAASACPPAHTCQNDTPSEINCLLLAP
jgi:hypothetical protein